MPITIQQLNTRLEGDDDDVFAEDDFEDDDLSCYAEEEALAASETSLCEKLSFLSYEDLPYEMYESCPEESPIDEVCTTDEGVSSLSVLTSSISMLGRSLIVPGRIIKAM